MEIDITDLITHPGFTPWEMSNSIANLGSEAGPITWRNSMALATRLAPNPLDTEEKREAWRDYVRSSGGWSNEEIEKWDDVHLNALFAQWVAGDIREGLGDDLPDDPADWPWAEYMDKGREGSVAGNIYRGDNGRVYFYAGS